MKFFTCGLLSKWGFGDGNQLFDLLLDHGLVKNQKQILAETVMRHVIPALDQSIKLVKVADWDWTSHNPIRAEKVNGIEVDDLGDKLNPTITPEFIDIDDEAILAIAREFSQLPAG